MLYRLTQFYSILKYRCELCCMLAYFIDEETQSSEVVSQVHTVHELVDWGFNP